MCVHFTRRTICLVVAAALLWQAPVVGAARAAMVTTETVLQAERSANAEASPRDRLRAFLRRQEVRAELEALGVDPAEAEARVASLGDAEVAALVTRIDMMPAGAGHFFISQEVILLLALVGLVALVVGFIWLIVTIGSSSGDDGKPAPPRTKPPSTGAPTPDVPAPSAVRW